MVSGRWLAGADGAAATPGVREAVNTKPTTTALV